MENASKALIIAGAILLSILIIGLGMYIYTQAAGVMGDANLDPQKVQSYNSPFLQYEGTQSGTNARALYNLIRSHNNANVDDTSLQVQLRIDGGDYEAGATQASYDGEASVVLPANTLKAGKTYNITFATDPNSGYITACNIQAKTK